TELFLESVLRDDCSVLDLLKADYTFLNERLAKHYGIPHVYGSRFRRVDLKRAHLDTTTITGPLPNPLLNPLEEKEKMDSGTLAYERGGLLRQGSILTVTSYATRTSPVIRGKWILEN